jgi:putative transcriptional regulator
MNGILNNVHKSARRLHDAGHLDNITMWEFDALCLPPKRVLSAEDVQHIRVRNQVSQAETA